MTERALVLDIGSNSTKSLVAERDPAGGERLRILHEGKRESRISRGIGRHPPRLEAGAIREGLAAVGELWEEGQAYGPFTKCVVVGTSAVRSAVNGREFTDGVWAICGEPVRVLTGEEEAEGIARGVRTDPKIGALGEYTVFDLGGGSLELIHFAAGGVLNHTSLPLGGVRLTEHFFKDPSGEIGEAEQERLAEHVEGSLRNSGVSLGRPLVGCSGGLASLAWRYAERNEAGQEIFRAEVLKGLRRRACELGRAERITECGMAAERADIYPAGLILISCLLRLTGAEEVLHCTHNLRFGLAAACLL